MVPVKKADESVEKCGPNQSAVVHWTAKLATTGKLVEDTKTKFGEDAPEEIWIGHRQTVRCLDLTLAQMRPGDIYHVTCPAQLAYGSVPTYSFFDDDVIPADSDLKYRIEFISCRARGSGKTAEGDSPIKTKVGAASGKKTNQKLASDQKILAAAASALDRLKKE